jgi:cyclophilin family peptidyl-prolyl cis-trans isomerase
MPSDGKSSHCLWQGELKIFGEITEGFDVITKLNEAYCDEKFKPFRDIRLVIYNF